MVEGASEASAARPVVRVVPLQPHCFAFGGFELQMLGAIASARDAGVDAAPLDPWSRKDDFDVVHLWGLDPQHLNLARWAREAGKKVVLSALLGYRGWRSSLRKAVDWMRGDATVGGGGFWNRSTP